jgi:hypothetical protein
VAGLRLRGVGPPVERLDAHLAHQRGDVQPSNLMALLLEKPLEHAAARERIVEMQFVDPAHQRQVGVAHGARQIVDAAPADAEDSGLPAHRQIMLPVDHL